MSRISGAPAAAIGTLQPRSFVGVRRAGKSTLMRQMINHLIRERSVQPRNILFCNLEMPVLNRYSLLRESHP
jgi:predicted AAA+ superfamily ATPase